MNLEILTIPSITIIVYWIIELIKQLTNLNEHFMRFVPITATFLGIILGLVIYFTMPELAIANNALFAIIAGGVSGLAATGSNQIIKQLLKYKSEPVEKTKNTAKNKTTKK